MSYADPATLTALVQDDVGEATATLLLDLASGAVDSYVRRPLGVSGRTEVFDPTGTSVLWVASPGWPLEVTTVTVGAETLAAGEDFTVRQDGSIVRAVGRWDEPVTVTYLTGFEPDSPQIATAKRVVLEAAARASANPQDLDSLGLDGASVNFRRGAGPVSLSRDHKADLEPLRWRRRMA